MFVDDLDTRLLEPPAKLLFYKCPACGRNQVKENTIKYVYVNDAALAACNCKCGQTMYVDLDLIFPNKIKNVIRN